MGAPGGRLSLRVMRVLPRKVRMESRQFQVFVSGSPSSADDWARAMQAPDDSLPQLTDEQRSVATKFGMTESEYARGVLVGEIGDRRQISRGERLGMLIGQLLNGLGPEYTLRAILLKGMEDAWRARIQARERVINVPIPLDLADDALDSGDVATVEKLKNYLLRGLDRSDVSAAS
jgi:hypothetical protein